MKWDRRQPTVTYNVTIRLEGLNYQPVRVIDKIVPETCFASCFLELFLGAQFQLWRNMNFDIMHDTID